MQPIMALALKDLRLLLRMRAGLFFTFVWPLLIAVGFGVILSGPSTGQSRMSVALVDEDHTPGSEAFLARLDRATELAVQRTSRAEAEESVRKGRRTAFVAVPRGFGAASERMFYGAPPTVELGLNPSRRAESGMLEGVLMKYGVQGMQEVFSNRAAGHQAVENARRSLPADTSADPDAASTAAFLSELDKFLTRPRTSESIERRQGRSARPGRLGAPHRGHAAGHGRRSRPRQHVRVHFSAGRHLGPHRLHHVVRRRPGRRAHARHARAAADGALSHGPPSSPAKGSGASSRP